MTDHIKQLKAQEQQQSDRIYVTPDVVLLIAILSNVAGAAFVALMDTWRSPMSVAFAVTSYALGSLIATGLCLGLVVFMIYHKPKQIRVIPIIKPSGKVADLVMKEKPDLKALEKWEL